MASIHNLGFPRIGAKRELKQAVESYWSKKIDQNQLLSIGRKLRQQHWQLQAEAGLDWIPVGDFSWYDQILDHSALLGLVPERFQSSPPVQDSDDEYEVDLDTYFRMARGRAPSGEPTSACEMTKWFDTNYHYLVPEFLPEQRFKLCGSKLFDEVEEATALGYKVKPVIPGPLTFLWLGKTKGKEFNKLSLLDGLLPVYNQILTRLKAQGVEWVQLDEPILALDLPTEWSNAFESFYSRIRVNGIKKMLAVYFGPLQDNLSLACNLPIDGLHVDAVRGASEITMVSSWLADYKVLSLGVIDGRNIWRANLADLIQTLIPVHEHRGEQLWLAPSCSLLHVPVDLEQEIKMEDELREWLAFAKQKLHELTVLKQAFNNSAESCADLLEGSARAAASRQQSSRIHKAGVKQRVADIVPEMAQRASTFESRIQKQQQRLKLPLFPTTTIGSFPQTDNIRRARRQFRQGQLTNGEYETLMHQEISAALAKQEAFGLDVLVHGEAERNDMVEYFGEQLDGFMFSEFGWVQSYGSRCVKPPIIYGDVSRPAAMTVSWIQYAQSQTDKPMKGMLTGPVTILNWSFVRDDQSRQQTCQQLALALRDEVCDLEKAGIGIIQIDEAALREGLPLRKRDWKQYLDWAVHAFRITASGVKDETQIHTHMCYSEFNDIMSAIAAMDADVITIETSRSDMELLKAFKDFAYPNDIGPGVYDIHSPNIPTEESMTGLINKALQHIPAERLWINPDCGLKTRNWQEVEQALVNMVSSAKFLRAQAATH